MPPSAIRAATSALATPRTHSRPASTAGPTLAPLAASAPAHAVERIIQFISDVAVQRDGELIVAETIRVEAEGNVIRRGIFRDFPTTYTRPDGTRVEVGFHVETVTRDGSPDTMKVTWSDGGRWGSASRLR